jgi:voltage-gated sodium channel
MPAVAAASAGINGAMDMTGFPKSGKGNRSSKVMLKLERLSDDLKKKEQEVKVPWIKTPMADTLFGIVILLNAGFIGVELELAPDGFSWVFWSMESIFLMTFLVELIMRMVAEWPRPWAFFVVGWEPQWWGFFDFGVTILGCLDAWLMTPILALNSSDGAESPMSSITVLRVFRLLRLARLIRVLRMFNELVILVQTLGNSIRAVGWMSLLLGMIIYTGSVICVILIGEPHRDDDKDIKFFFGTLGDALFSHFCVVTLEGWPDIARSAMRTNSMWALYFIAMITLTNFALVNLMVGVIVERIIHYSSEQETELSAFVAESEQFRATLNTLFNESDMDHNGTVTREEIRTLMENPKTHQIMNAFGINLDIPQAALFTIMDLNRDGPTDFEEFFTACMRLCGSKQSIHSIFVQHDICECRNDIQHRLDNLVEHVRKKGPRMPGRPLAALPGGAQQEILSPEECVNELLERMDRFGQVQLQICAEVEALKEQARVLEKIGQPRSSTGVTVVQSGRGREVGGCCTIDTLFSRRKEPSPSRRISSSDQNVGKQARKELEAEFRRTKK